MCFNIMRERGLVHCRNPTCGAVLGSYEEGAVIIVHLFNVREMFFEPQLHYSREVGGPIPQDYVVVMKFGDDESPQDISDSVRAKSYVLDPAVLPNSSNLVIMPVVSQCARSCSDKRVATPIREPVAKIARPVPGLSTVGTNVTTVIVGSKPSTLAAGRRTTTVLAGSNYTGAVVEPSYSKAAVTPITSTIVTGPSISGVTSYASTSTAVVRPSASLAISGSDVLLSQSMNPLVSVSAMSFTDTPGDVTSAVSEIGFNTNVPLNVDLTSEFQNFCGHADEELPAVVEEDYFKLFGLE